MQIPSSLGPSQENAILDFVDDGELLERFVRDKDEAAFEMLVNRHGPMVKGVCQRVLLHKQDSEDAFQATFLILSRKAGSIQRQQSLSSWLYKVAYRIALRARSRKAKQHSKVGRLHTKLDLAGPAQAKDSSMLDEEIQKLPEKYRIPILLCYLQGWTNEEAARQMRCPTGTIKIRLSRARDMLRKRLGRKGAVLLLGLLAGRAQAAVTKDLTKQTVDAGIEYETGMGLPEVSAEAFHLAETWLKRGALSRVKVGCIVLLTVILMLFTDCYAQFAQGAGFSVNTKPSLEQEPELQYSDTEFA